MHLAQLVPSITRIAYLIHSLEGDVTHKQVQNFFEITKITLPFSYFFNFSDFYISSDFSRFFPIFCDFCNFSHFLKFFYLSDS